MKDLIYKIRYSVCFTIKKKWRQIFSCWFAIIGALFTISELINSVFNQPVGYVFLKTFFVLLNILAIFCSILVNLERLKCSYFLAGTDTKITLKVGDILKQKGAIIIPTNSTFDTLMDGEFISQKSVQGQFQKKHYYNDLNSLNMQLSEELNHKPFIELTDGRTTNTKQYEIGTVCKISKDNNHTYFLAVANINKFGKPINAKMDDITAALVSLWHSLNTIGHLEELSIPLIGTGRAAIKNTSRDIIIQEILFSFIVAAKEMKVTEDLTICIHQSDFAEKNLHWEDMCEYLSYMCKFKYVEKTVEGHPELEVAVV